MSLLYHKRTKPLTSGKKLMQDLKPLYQNANSQLTSILTVWHCVAAPRRHPPIDHTLSVKQSNPHEMPTAPFWGFPWVACGDLGGFRQHSLHGPSAIPDRASMLRKNLETPCPLPLATSDPMTRSQMKPNTKWGDRNPVCLLASCVA